MYQLSPNRRVCSHNGSQKTWLLSYILIFYYLNTYQSCLDLPEVSHIRIRNNPQNKIGKQRKRFICAMPSSIVNRSYISDLQHYNVNCKLYQDFKILLLYKMQNVSIENMSTV